MRKIVVIALALLCSAGELLAQSVRCPTPVNNNAFRFNRFNRGAFGFNHFQRPIVIAQPQIITTVPQVAAFGGGFGFGAGCYGGAAFVPQFNAAACNCQQQVVAAPQVAPVIPQLAFNAGIQAPCSTGLGFNSGFGYGGGFGLAASPVCNSGLGFGFGAGTGCVVSPALGFGFNRFNRGFGFNHGLGFNRGIGGALPLAANIVGNIFGGGIFGNQGFLGNGFNRGFAFRRR